jgi:hypothetical protein
MASLKWFTIAWTCSSSRIWSDIGTEKTIKHLKGSGGIVGITNQKSALVRWTLTRYFLASFSSAMNDRAGITSTSHTSHEEMKQTASGMFGIHVFKCFQF